MLVISHDIYFIMIRIDYANQYSPINVPNRLIVSLMTKDKMRWRKAELEVNIIL